MHHGHARGRFFQQRKIDGRCGGRVVEVVVALGNEAVDDGARILPLRQVLLHDPFALVRDLEIFAAAAVADAAPVRGDVVLAFQPLQCAVQGGLLQHILSFALRFDLADDLVAVFVSVIEGTENNGVDVAADQVAADGGCAVGSFVLIVAIVNIHISPSFEIIILYLSFRVNVFANIL